MGVLRTEPNISDVDDIYERLLGAHVDRTLEESLKLAVRLNFILINHIGDRTVIDEAIALAASPPAHGRG